MEEIEFRNKSKRELFKMAEDYIKQGKIYEAAEIGHHFLANGCDFTADYILRKTILKPGV